MGKSWAPQEIAAAKSPRGLIAAWFFMARPARMLGFVIERKAGHANAT
jgi:hypothetical protein